MMKSLGLLTPLRSKMISNWPTKALLLLALSAAIMLPIGGDNPLGAMPQKELLYTLLSAAMGVSALVILAVRKDIQLSTTQILLLAVLVRVLATLAWPLLEDDYFRYLWDGRQTALFFSPWQNPPEHYFSETGLSQHWQWILNNINYPELPSIYGPVLQYLFALAYYIAPGNLTALQCLLVAVDLGILFSLYIMGASSRWLTAYAIHPLILKEAIASAHPDLIVALGLIWAVYGWQHQRPVLTGIAFGVALGAKVAALVALPFILFQTFTLRDYQGHCRWLFKMLASSGITLAVLYLPLLQISGSEWYSLQTFAREWRFNPLVFRLLETLAPANSTRTLAAVILIAGLTTLWVRWRRQANGTPPPVDLALLLLLLLSPVVNNWYWLWLLPLSVLSRRGWLFVFCSFTVISYYHDGNLYPTSDPKQFYVSPWITTFQLSVLMLCFFLQRHYQKKSLFMGLGRNKINSPESTLRPHKCRKSRCIKHYPY